MIVKIASFVDRRCVSFIIAPLLIGLSSPGVFAQSKSIIIGEGVRGAMYLPAYIAEEKGFFKKRELDTRMVTFSRSNDINALVSGDIQFFARRLNCAASRWRSRDFPACPIPDCCFA